MICHNDFCIMEIGLDHANLQEEELDKNSYNNLKSDING